MLIFQLVLRMLVQLVLFELLVQLVLQLVLQQLWWTPEETRLPQVLISMSFYGYS